MTGFRSTKLPLIVAVSLMASAGRAESYLCQDSAGVSIDHYGIATSSDDGEEFARQQWIVDTERGWRRADLPDFSGSCESRNGYVVCRAQDIAFGEATFSIHPNGENFVLVFIDYGLDALTFIGKCARTLAES